MFRLTYLLLFIAACGTVTAYQAEDSGVSSRGDVNNGTGGNEGTGGHIGVGGTGVGGAGTGGVIGTGGYGVGGYHPGLGGFDGGDAAAINCAPCMLNCRNGNFPATDPRTVTSCDGCISNCPVNGLKLLCMCNDGCGYNPVEGVCNPIQ